MKQIFSSSKGKLSTPLPRAVEQTTAHGQTSELNIGRSPSGGRERKKVTFTQGKISCQAHPIKRVRPTNKLKTDYGEFFCHVEAA